MATPTQYSHLYRLGLVLGAGFLLLLLLISLLTPPSWNYEVWYRGEALTDIKSLPIIHGDNVSCVECHADESEELAEFAHKSLNCEGCHGPLTAHVRDGEKVADAVGKSDWQCLNCHRKEISRPATHPQFPGDIKEHQHIKKKTMCVKCHDPHDPALSEESQEGEDSFEF